MADQRQVHKPIAVNLDKSKKYLGADEAFYLLNRERNINGTGSLGKTTPLVANYLACLIDQPAGNNYNSGRFYSVLTNELYWWTWNSNGVNYIARINGDGTCQVVYDGPCIPLSVDPAHTIEQFKAYLKYDRFCAHQHGKQLIWCNGLNEIGMIDVEASIATNSFTTSFFDICPDECAPVQMCVPEPCGALEGEFIPLAGSQVDLSNHLLDVGIKVRFRWIYYDQRASEWSDISTLYWQDSRGCFDTSEGFSRCMKFRLPVGNPLVDKIEFAKSTDNGVNWESVEVVEKYKPYSTAAQYWYDRELADLLNFSTSDCSFDYIFCNDKNCNPISSAQTLRVYNPMPRQPQGILPISHEGETALGFYNYLKGNCPLDGSQAKKFEIGIECSNTGCVQQYATVTVRTIIHHSNLHINGFVYRLGGNSLNAPDDLTDIARFGTALLPPDGYGQFFKDTTRNFIAYVEGTNYWAQMQQYHSSAYLTNTILSGIVSGMDNFTLRQQAYADIVNGNFYYQEYKVKVPKGTRGFIRIASHQVTNGLPGEGQNKSTFVIGSVPDIHGYRGNIDLSGVVETLKKELYFDTCAGDVTLNETLIIDDNYTPFESGSHTSSAYSGYLTDANNKPVEGAEISYDGTARATTDFNGFYSFSLYGDENNQTIQVQVRVETNCVGGFNDVKTVTLSGGYGQLVQTDIQISDTDDPGYKSNFYEIVHIPVKDCDNTPIGGIRVALKGSKYQISDGVTGIATFHVRNYSNRARTVRAVVMDIENCFSLDCSNQCNPCIPETNDTALSSCFSGTPSITINLTSLLNKDSASLNKYGLKSGGRYPFGFVVQGDCGRISAVYPATILSGSLALLDNFLNIPKTQEKGSLSFCNFTYRGVGMELPDWATCLKIVRGTNVNNYELQWVIDKIERTIDNKIRLTIQSLNDYNATYNFETNTNYQYQKNDRVEFINNGDGTIFDIPTYGLLNYQILSPFHDKVISGQADAPADFFNQILIEDDGKLEALTVGAKIELQRPADCTVEPTYQAILTLPLVNISGQTMLLNPTGTFQTFDTFLVNRQISTQVGVSYPPQQFEHKFPSDFWGQNAEGSPLGLNDLGKVYFVNKFENEKRVGRNVTVNSVNQFNRFGDLEKTFDAPEQGDIIGIGVYDGKIGVAIGEFDNFLFQISDEFLKLGTGGLVTAVPADSLISDGVPKVSGIFGCRYQSAGSIYFGDGFITWIDSGKGAYVKHDFNIAKDMSEGKFKSWIKRMCQYIENFNRTATNDASKFRWLTGYNFHTNALQLTVKALDQDDINNEQEPYIKMNQTILLEIRSEELLTFASYTQEGYSNLTLNNSTGCAFVSFYHGVPYIHPVLPISFNEFNGKAVDCVIGLAINMKDKIVRPLSMQVQDEIMWFSSKIKVDDPTFESEIPPIRWEKTENKWDAEFLCDKNSRGGLYGIDEQVAGKKPSGYFCAVTMVRDNTDALKYGTIDNAKRVKFDELDLFISKFLFSEESGYTENL